MTGEDLLYLMGCEMDTNAPNQSHKGSVTSSAPVGHRVRLASLQWGFFKERTGGGALSDAGRRVVDCRSFGVFGRS